MLNQSLIMLAIMHFQDLHIDIHIPREATNIPPVLVYVALQGVGTGLGLGKQEQVKM